MLTVALTEPPLLLAEIVNVLSVIIDVGVPQIVPLLVPKDKTAWQSWADGPGRDCHPRPDSVAVSGKSVLDLTLGQCQVLWRVSNGRQLVENLDCDRRCVQYRQSCVTVIVYVVLVDSAVGVPEISPLVKFKLNPAGRSGLME